MSNSPSPISPSVFVQLEGTAWPGEIVWVAVGAITAISTLSVLEPTSKVLLLGGGVFAVTGTPADIMRDLKLKLGLV